MYERRLISDLLKKYIENEILHIFLQDLFSCINLCYNEILAAAIAIWPIAMPASLVGIFL